MEQEEKFDAEQDENKDKEKSNIWKIALIIICFAILFHGYFFSVNQYNNILLLILSNLPSSLIIWGIFYLLFARKTGLKIGFISFFIVFICMLLGYLIGDNEQKLERIRTLENLNNAISTANGSITYPDDFSENIDQSEKTTSKINNDLDKIEKFLRNYFNEIESIRNEYFLELESIGWNRILDVDRIENDNEFIESNIIINRTKELLTKYKKRMDSFLYNTRENLRSLDINENYKHLLLSGFEKGFEQKVKLDKMWELEKRVIEEVKNIINLLSTRRDFWIISNGKILFYYEKDLKRFEKHILSIQNILNHQQSLQKEIFEDFNKIFNQMLEINELMK